MWTYLCGTVFIWKDAEVKQAGRRICLKHIQVSLESDLKKNLPACVVGEEPHFLLQSVFSEEHVTVSYPLQTHKPLLWGISVILLCVLLALYEELLVSRRE